MVDATDDERPSRMTREQIRRIGLSDRLVQACVRAEALEIVEDAPSTRSKSRVDRLPRGKDP